jgi:hypothetical protein
MMESPIYPEVDQLFSFYGLEMDDLLILLLIFAAVENVISRAHAHAGRMDLTLPLAFLATGVLFSVWRAFKAGRPRHFLEDSLALLNEPDVWILTGDAEIRPSYILEPDGRLSIAPADTSPPPRRSP